MPRSPSHGRSTTAFRQPDCAGDGVPRPCADIRALESAALKLPVRPRRHTRTSSDGGGHTSAGDPRGECCEEHGLRPCGLTNSEAHRASHRPAVPAGTGWRPCPLRAPWPGADHAAPSGAAARSQLHGPHRSRQKCRAAPLHHGRLRRLPRVRHPGPRASVGSKAKPFMSTQHGLQPWHGRCRGRSKLLQPPTSRARREPSRCQPMPAR